MVGFIIKQIFIFKINPFQKGLVLLSLALGEQVNDYHPKIPNTLAIEFKNFISK
jgi:hypothetical protein